MSKTLVFDIECDGLLLDVSKFWVGVTYCLETKQYESFRDPYSLVVELNSATLIIGHNIIGYDIPVLEKLTGIEVTTKVVDTLILGKLAYYNKGKDFKHSLDEYGKRLKVYKGSYNDWSKYTPEMEAYCKQDVQVTNTLYKHLKRKTVWLPEEALHIETQVQKIITDQYINGWEFDIEKGERLHVELLQEYETALGVLQETFRPKLLPKGKATTPKKPFTRLGVSTLGPHQPIRLVEFNPGSGDHIVWWVDLLYGKQPWRLTDKGNPKTDADTLIEMFEDKSWARPLLHYIEVTKLLGQLASGKKAWLAYARRGRIHGNVDILGTVSGRATHSSPNMAQVPSVRAYKGKEARELFTVPKGKVLVAADLSGVELRCLAHYMARYDDGKYSDIILHGDIHTANMEAAGLTSRDQAKTMIYGYLFGAGDGKLGQIVGGGTKEGKLIRNTFERKIPALKLLNEAVKKTSSRKYLTGITGRRLHIRSPHSALNVLLQSLGAYISKMWMIVVNEKIKKEGLDAKQISWVHDELEFECRADHSEKLSKILEESALEAGKRLGIRMPIHAEAQEGVSWDQVH